MSLDPKIAAKVAKKHGLTLGDAAALVELAETEDDADELAEQFAPDDAAEEQPAAAQAAADAAAAAAQQSGDGDEADPSDPVELAKHSPRY